MSRQTKEYVYEGALAFVIQQYVAEKRGQGIQFNQGAQRLKHFDTFSKSFDLKENELPKSLVLAYVAASDANKSRGLLVRVRLLNGLASFMIRCGYFAEIQPSEKLCHSTSPYEPYIFSDGEIRRLFEACDGYSSNYHNKYQHLVIPMMFKIFICCGLRSSEAANLNVDDVDLDKGVLRIMDTKFEKNRYVPMSVSLWEDCKKYSQAMHKTSAGKSPYLPNRFREHYSKGAIYEIFRVLMLKADISHSGAWGGPRLHDLRHTFSVHSLRHSVLNNENLTVILPYLSSYLGHTGLAGTQKYLRLTADLYPDITKKLSLKFGDIIPIFGGTDYEE